jgi:hypothetical protein
MVVNNDDDQRVTGPGKCAVSSLQTRPSVSGAGTGER